MSLTQAIGAATAGLQVAQAQLSLISGNVANAQTPGYVRKTLDQLSTSAGGTMGVVAGSVNRELDQLVQTQLRTETSGGSYATMLSSIYQQIQQIIGQPGSAGGLDTLFNAFTNSLQALTTSPSSYAAQAGVLSAARQLTQQLNNSAQAVQGLRESAEQGIAGDVTQVNNALQQIAKINKDLTSANPADPSTATLMDQRDSAIDQLSKLMDIRVAQDGTNQVSVYTGNGLQLVGAGSVAQLTFDARSTMTASSQWNSDPAKSGVGSIKLVLPNGASTDLIAAGAFKSGEITAYLKMRDQVLPQVQNQFDQFAAQMSLAASTLTTNGTPVNVGAQNGYSVDVGGLLSGNTVNLTYTDSATNTQHTVSLVRVDDPSALPLQNASGNSNRQTIGIDFSKGIASVTTQIAQALGASGLQVSNPSGTTIQILDDGAVAHVRLNAASTTATVTGLTSGNAQLPLFTDGSVAFSNAVTAAGSQATGFAQRIGVNASLLANPSLLINFQSTGTAAGDLTRPNFLLDQLVNGSFQFSPSAGIGTAASPFSGNLSSYLSQVFSSQGQAASNASNLKEGQDLVVNALQQRMNGTSGVNIDQEMANLLTLQNSYAANAHVLSAVKQMFDALMTM